MSGIIGGAGSKSGVIGTTELDYEEGTWTVTGTNVLSQGARYVKIGNMVTCFFRAYASGGSMDLSPGGLPFTSAAAIGSEYSGGGSVTYQNESADTWNVRVGASTNTFALYKGSTNVQCTAGANFHATVTYQAV